MVNIDRDHLHRLIRHENARFLESHKKSSEFSEMAKISMPHGVPMNWMSKWASPHPIFIEEAKDNRLIDVDGNRYVDFCLGDTGAMTGHSPPDVIEDIIRQLKKGITFMCPTEDSIWVTKELQKRFLLPFWQIALSATDANRFAIRLARHVTGRKKILVFNWCYHGSVDETLITIEHGKPVARKGNIGPPINPTETTCVIEFNDIAALKKELASKEFACVLTEPALTNIGIVHPDSDFHDALRQITYETDTILIIDETHTICCGPGGFTKAHGLKPDILTIGKPLASGVPAATYGFTEKIAERMLETCTIEDSDTSGIGGTLSGNALSIAAMRATLEKNLTQSSFDRMIPLAERFVDGVASVIREYELPWNVTRLGTRTEYWFRSKPAHNGGEAAAAIDIDLDKYMHLYAINNGILMTPFHNMALMSPSTRENDVDLHTRIFKAAVENLVK